MGREEEDALKTIKPRVVTVVMFVLRFSFRLGPIERWMGKLMGKSKRVYFCWIRFTFGEVAQR